jgi:glycosyltransferase involved in cell wall biosynthesis
MNKVLLLADPDSIHTKKWCEGWRFIGYKTELSGISNNQSNKLIIKDNISPTGGNGLTYLKNIFKFKNILHKIDPAIINSHYLTSYGLISALIKRKKDFLVLSVHGTDIMQDIDKNIIYLLMAKYIFHKSDIIVSVSDIMTKKILKYFPNVKDKIITQQYGINIKLLDSFYSKNKDIFISTNRQWKPNSNYPIILKALLFFSNENIKIIGSYGDEYSNDLLNKYPLLKKYSTGIIPYETNLQYVARSKIFISLPLSDGSPLSLIEAMYLGAIPIVSDIPPNRELIKDGINGFLVDIDADALKNKIIEVNNLDDNKVKLIQEYNKKLILEKFDFEKNFNNLNKILKNIKKY